jgi:hypothetical protein
MGVSCRVFGAPCEEPGFLTESGPRLNVVALMRSNRLALRTLRVAACAAVVALVGFHAWLLFARLSSARPLAAEEAARWILGAGLLAAFLALNRLGVPLLWGRKAIVLWLLVVALHGSAAAPTLEGGDIQHGPWRGAEAVFVLPAAIGGALVVLAALGVLGARSFASQPQAPFAQLVPVAVGARRAARAEALWSRPPPVPA